MLLLIIFPTVCQLSIKPLKRAQKMKLLGWMHNKFWQSGIESVKDFTIANPCMCLTLQKPVDDEDIYLKPGFGFTTVQSDSRNYEQSSLGVEANNVLEKCGDLSNSSDIFHGFLTIGTLGSEPATPTFSLAFENMIELPDEVTEDDLKLINYELEKFLEAETKEDRCDQSPGRTSHASIITLAGKHMEETKDENDGKTTCPLQGYLFGSTIELPDKMIDMRKETPSSPELFQDTIAENESFKLNIEKKKALVKHSNKSALTFVKKMLKKLCTSSHGSSTYDSGDSHSTKKKLQKVLRKLNRKIHPETSTAMDECQKSQKYIFENVSFDNFNNDSVMNRVEDGITYCQEFISKEEMCYWKTNLGLPLYGIDTNVSSANRGHWIKTDAEYLVLEL
ncbi:protein LAZY 1 isoform X3 [Cucumis sativus]|uniref:protein LAZY 1 isoform X3 n=1 Tax=Cucumis sativus TaxID=3659 RepID=UPI0012F4FFB9|nr:protein LAZY 1 isoform X3 [Cucumis sativus]